MSRAARSMYERSGSRCGESGVGTAMTIASASRTDEKSVVAVIAPESTSGFSVSGGHVLDVALAAVDRIDDRLDDVDEHDLLARLREGLRVRHADVAGADDRDVPAHSGAEGYRAAAMRPDACPSP